MAIDHSTWLLAKLRGAPDCVALSAALEALMRRRLPVAEDSPLQFLGRLNADEHVLARDAVRPPASLRSQAGCR